MQPRNTSPGGLCAPQRAGQHVPLKPNPSGLQDLRFLELGGRPEWSSDQPFEHIFAAASVGLGGREQPDSFGGCRVLVAELLLLLLPAADTILVHPYQALNLSPLLRAPLAHLHTTTCTCQSRALAQGSGQSVTISFLPTFA